jgi:hypothetical protein
MGQPYSDADLIIQHSNMPNTENFRALKMEFLDCDVSQFSTSRPSLTHTQPNPQHLRIHKTWDEYCHRIQRFNASDPKNQPKSALSAKMLTDGSPSEVKALAASEEPLDAMMRRIISEYTAKAPAKDRFHSSQPNNHRTYTTAETDAYKRRRTDTRAERPPYQDRHAPQTSYQPRDRARIPYNPSNPTAPTQQPQRSNRGRSNARQAPYTHQRNSTQGRFNPRTQDRAAFGATEEDNDYEEDSRDFAHYRAFTASAHPSYEDRIEEEGEDRCAMMGRRDYDFTDFNEDDEDQA